MKRDYIVIDDEFIFTDLIAYISRVHQMDKDLYNYKIVLVNKDVFYMTHKDIELLKRDREELLNKIGNKIN